MYWLALRLESNEILLGAHKVNVSVLLEKGY